MNIEIFNQNYWVRRAGEPYTVKGYWVYPTEDYVASLHIHPMGGLKLLTLPEGESISQRLEGHGSDKLNVSGELGDDSSADLLWYQGHWWECVSAVEWHDTGLLSHYNYEFALVTSNSSNTVSTENPPEEDPDIYADTKHLPVT